MLVEKFDGQPIEEVKQFTAKDMLDLFGVRLTPNRQKCCLLVVAGVAGGHLFARCRAMARPGLPPAAERCSATAHRQARVQAEAYRGGDERTVMSQATLA